MSETRDLTVFYDGACPLCTREIGFYRRRKGAERVQWVDVSASETCEIAPGLTRDQALARFHVAAADGSLVSGGAAFARLWATLPGFRLVGRLMQVGPLTRLADWAYDRFLRIRPRLQARLAVRAMPSWLVRELRSDHAGETGAVAIYRGILAVTRDDAVRRFAAHHLETERRHLEKIEAILPRRDRSVFLPLWRVAGAMTGALPALAGRNAVYATIDAVETFVDRHYAAQIDRLAREDAHPEIRAVLEECRDDEIRHRDEARAARQGAQGTVARGWCWMVGFGSAAAVSVARKL